VQRDDCIYVAGADTLVGAAIVRRLQHAGFERLVGLGHGDDAPPDLRDAASVRAFLERHQPRYIIHAGGVSAGIQTNRTSPADMAAANLAIDLNLIQAARQLRPERFIYLGSSCCYPVNAPQPLAPQSLWTGPLEPTSHAYASAKLSAMSLCQAIRQQDGCDFITAIPATVFGPGDHGDAERSHVVSALLAKFRRACAELASEIEIWGTGSPVREFIAADDVADACVMLLTHLAPPDVVNLGSGEAVTIATLVDMLVEITGYQGRIVYDCSKPDGAPHKELDSSWLFSTGWSPSRSLRQWLEVAYASLAKQTATPSNAASVTVPQIARPSATVAVDTPLDQPLDVTLYRQLYRIRRVEEEIARVYPTDCIQSPVHLSIGQEAVSVAVCEALAASDVAFGSYRSHAYYLAKGGDLRGMIAELYGKVTGVAKGKAGSMHLIDTAAGVMGASAVVGSTLPQAVGYALGAVEQGRNQVVAVFFGEGATEEGVFAESLNFAALKKLPVLFVCENNGYAIHSRQQDRQALPDVTARAASLGVPARRFEEMDIYQLFAASCEAVETIRQGGGPQFFECCCYRWMEHVGPQQDFGVGYRPAAEAEPWMQRDALNVVAARLSDRVRREIETQVEEEINDAFAFAQRSDWPGPSELFTDLYA